MLAWANHDVHDVLAPMNAVIGLVGWVAFIAGVVWGPFLHALPLLALAGVWSVGRNQKTAPVWALPVDGDERDVIPDENAIMRALGKLSIPQLNAAIKEGWKSRWVADDPSRERLSLAAAATRGRACRDDRSEEERPLAQLDAQAHRGVADRGEAGRRTRPVGR
ncbi:hypothetical protein ACFWOX_04795 [Streptomyces sp. NPDC058467]|uniref:hypothetical protein n=1 Tax=Streptomyces sp. NPDC058467 TaxID=3346513 RepID=UPI00365D280E